MSAKKDSNRREFIKTTTAVAIGGALTLGLPGTLKAKGSRRAKVVLVRDKSVLDGNGKPKAAVIQEMLDKAVTTLTGHKDVVAAWKTLIRPEDVVGIKSNVWHYIPTTSQVEKALEKRVLGAGVKQANIAIDDRGVLSNPVFQRATALINARPMRSHHWSGVGSLIKNYVMFVDKPFEYHDDSCAPLGSIWKLPLVKDKTRLNVLVMLTPQFHSVGPHSFHPKYVWNYYGLLVGFDPVAVDTIGLRIIEAKRREFFAEDRPLVPPAKHIALADTRYKLGTSNPKCITLTKLGYDKDLLL